jgi:hypothetical protein
MSFQVGDVVVVQGACTVPGFTPGTEHTVERILDPALDVTAYCKAADRCLGGRYVIGAIAHYFVVGCDNCLRKKRPPQRSTQELVDELMSKIQSPEEELA